MSDKGLHSFISQKINMGVDEQSIKNTLIRAGFSDGSIAHVLEEVKKEALYTVHQKEVADNGFLPPLKNNRVDNSVSDLQKNLGDLIERGHEKDFKLKIGKENDLNIGKGEARQSTGLFKGRLLRRDFIMGFLLFFGLGYVGLVLAGSFISFFFPHISKLIMDAVVADDQGLFLFSLPLLLLPITIMLMSLITRRLHNIGFSGELSLLFFAIIIPSSGIMSFYGLKILQVVIVIMFAILLLKKGDPRTNIYGPYPSSKGSFFKRVFNV